MRRHYFLFALIIIILLNSSCILPFLFHSDMTGMKKLEGKQIANYPKWIADIDLRSARNFSNCGRWIKSDLEGLIGFSSLYLGSSDWIKCDNDNARVILKIIPDNIIDKNYDGFFRIDLYGQYMVVYFNKIDEDGELVGKYFYNWIGDAKFISDIDVEIEQEDNDIFSYDSYLKKSLYGNIADAEKVKITFINLGDNKYKYKINFDNEFFECEIANSNKMLLRRVIEFDLINNNFPILYSIKGRTEDKLLFEFIPGDIYSSDSEDKGRFFFSPFCYVNSIWFVDGATFKEFDPNLNKVSFNIFGCNGERVDFADYFEIHVKSKDDVVLTFYKLNNDNQPVVVKSYSKPELTWEWKTNIL